MINLKTLLTAMEEGVYAKKGNKIKKVRHPLFIKDDKYNCIGFYVEHEFFKMCDYGITWALTKFELL